MTTPDDIVAHVEDLGGSRAILDYLKEELPKLIPAKSRPGNPDMKTNERIRALAVKAMGKSFELKWHASAFPPTRAMVARLATKDGSADFKSVKNYLDRHWSDLLGMFDSPDEIRESHYSANSVTEHESEG